MNPEVSVVILCYKAGDRLYGFVEKIIGILNSGLRSWEIILVGNYIHGSDDTTPEVVKDIASKNEHIKAITMPKSGMMGWDARCGLDSSTGEYICIIDGDEQMPPEDIIRVYKKITDEKLDFVQTYRSKRYDGVWRKFISSVYNLLFRLLFPAIKLKDVNSKPKILRRDRYEKMRLFSNDWFFDADIVIQAWKQGLKIGEMPTEFYKCGYRSSFIGIKAIMEFVKNLFIVKVKDMFNG